MQISLTEVSDVGSGGRGASQVCSRRGSRDGLFDDVSDPGVRLVQLG